MPKRINRVREVLKGLGLKQAQAAELCGIDRERFRKILGNRVEILGWELMNIARALDTDANSLYEPDEVDIRTLQRETMAPRLSNTAAPKVLRRAYLVADDEESVYWLRQGLLQQEFLIEGPGVAKVALQRGRILLGRAVEQLGTTLDEKQPGMIVANQLLSIRRQEHDEDRKLSRFQLDLTFCGTRECLSVYVQSSAIKAELQGAWHIAMAGEGLLLSDQDRILLPNEKTLRLELRESTPP